MEKLNTVMEVSGTGNMPINYKNLTPNVYQSTYSNQSKAPKSSQSYPVMGTQKPVQSGTSAIKSFFQPITPKTTQPQMSVNKPVVSKPVMSVAPTQSKVIQGSGMTSQYASNPANYKAPAPTPAPTQAPTMNSWMNNVNALNQRTSQFYDTSQANRIALAQKQYEDTLALQNEMYGNANNDLKAQIPILDERFGKFESGVRANMAEADQIGATQKANAQTYTGDAQRTAMQNKRQTDSQREKQYAALGTIDSYGTGSFTGGNANADSEFNRGTQQRYDALAQNLTSIDSTITKAKTDALNLIDTEKMKYEDTVRQINSQLRDNDVARRGAIQQEYYATQEAINNISDQYEGLRIAQEQQKLTFQQEMEKLTAENTMPTVSDWFLQTGQPQTQEDLVFIKNNPDGATAYSKLLGTGSGTKKTEKQSAFANAAQSGQYALNLLNSGQVESGFGQGVMGSIGERTGSNSSTQQDYRSTIAAARTLARNAMLGANMSPKELESLSALIPEYSDDPAIAKQKLTTFVRVMSQYSNTEVDSSQGLTPEVLAQLDQFNQ